MRHKPKLAAALAAAALLGGIAVWALPGESGYAYKPALGLFTSLPIYWAESDSIAETLNGSAAPHWARTALEADNALVPLDTLDSAELQPLDRLIMAQPRPLSPAENVALDNWVRGGGRLLLFADPMLTEPSRFALGDKRRPQDVVLLSPILRRWGLELEFDENQPDTQRTVAWGHTTVPVRLPGALRKVPFGEAADCDLQSESIVAQCVIGKGRVVVVADAAMLGSEQDSRVGSGGLTALTTVAFGS